MLINLGLVENGQITEKGREVLELIQSRKHGLNVRLGTAFVEWYQKDYVLYPMLVLISILECYNGDYYVYPTSNAEETLTEYNQRYQDYHHALLTKFGGNSDIQTYLNIWNRLLEITESKNFLHDPVVKQFMSENHLNFVAFNNVAFTLNNLVADFSTLGYDILEHPFDVQRATDLVRPILSRVFADTIAIRDGVNYKNGNDIYSLGPNSINRLSLLNPEKVIAIIASRFETETGPFNSIEVGMDF